MAAKLDGVPVEPAYAEERRAPRRPVAVPGVISLPGYRLTVPCRIVDMSATGAGAVITLDQKARVRLARELPDRVVLRLPNDRLEVDCLIRWRNRERFGARFVSVTRPLKAASGL